MTRSCAATSSTQPATARRARRPGDPRARTRRPARPLEELAGRLPRGRDGPLEQGALPRLRLEIRRVQLLGLAALARRGPAGRDGGRRRRAARVRDVRPLRRAREGGAGVHERACLGVGETDDALWARLREHFTDDQIVELATSSASRSASSAGSGPYSSAPSGSARTGVSEPDHQPEDYAPHPATTPSRRSRTRSCAATSSARADGRAACSARSPRRRCMISTTPGAHHG
jgi:hypothetical protein